MQDIYQSENQEHIEDHPISTSVTELEKLTKKITNNPEKVTNLPTSEKRKSLVFTIASILVLFIAGSTIGFNEWQKSKYVAINNPLPETGNSEKDYSNITENWKSYTNDFNQYSLKYPTNWEVQEDINNNPGRIFVKPIETETQYGMYVMPDFFSLNSDKDLDTTMNTFMQQIDPATNTLESTVYKFEKKIKVNDKDAWFTSGGCCMGYGIHVFVANDNKVWKLILQTDTSTERPYQYEDIFNQILSTFKFENTGYWQTYTNSQGSRVD